MEIDIRNQRNVVLINELEVDNHRPLLQEGERVTYKLNSVYEIDKHWKHYSYQLDNNLKSHSIYFFNTYNFWIYLDKRGKTEIDYQQHLEKKGISVYHTLNGDTGWEKLFYKRVKNENYRINIDSDLKLSRLDNISIFDNYILNTKVKESFYKEIENLYQQELTESDLKLAINQRAKESPCKLTLERNNKKATRLKRLLSKNFT